MKVRENLNIAVPFLDRVKKQPDHLALRIGEENYTYAEIALRAGQIASWLAGVRKERELRVGILGSRSVEVYTGILGAFWSGCAFVPLNPKFPQARLRSMIRRSGLDALIVDRSGLENLRNGLASDAPRAVLSPQGPSSQIGSLQLIGCEEARKLRPPVPDSVSAEDLAYILFTSGTTGDPKGVMVSAGNLFHVLRVCRERYRFSEEDRISQAFETTYDASFFVLLMAWWNGASLHVVPESELMAPAHFIRSNELTVWNSVPAIIGFLRRMSLLKPGCFPSLRYSLFGGDPLSVGDARAWQEAAPGSVLENLYGPTELTINCSIETVCEPIHVTRNRGVVSIGKPLRGMRAGLVDEAEGFLTEGKVGELAFSGPMVTPGYLEDPELTAARYRELAHPKYGRSIWYLTGDLAYEDEHGFLHLVGRIDNQVKILGQRVELEEVERHLKEIEPGAEFVCVAWPVKDAAAQGIVAFASKTSHRPSEILEKMKKKVPVFMVPGELILVDAIPHSPHGKVDRSELVRRLEKGELRA